MAVFRRRLIFWLIKAYLKKWGKVIGLSFLIGLVLFFILLSSSSKLAHLVHFKRKTTIGLVGAYTSDTIPRDILTKVSHGLTKIDDTGEVLPDVASSWKVEKNGKKYTFFIRKNLTFTNGLPVTAKTISYNFSDVSISRPDDYTIVFELKNAYSPFLVTVSRPIFLQNSYTGIGDYALTSVELNGNFIKTIRIGSLTDKANTEDYLFYPTTDTLKTAFSLGEVTTAVGLNDQSISNTTFSSFPGIKVQKSINYDLLVTLFYNTQDETLTDKQLREALSYAIPNTFPQGERTYESYPPTMWYYNQDLEARQQDLAHAKLLLTAYETTANTKRAPIITLKTLPKYRKTAEAVAAAWKLIGIDSKIQNTDTIPPNFQVYLGDFNLPHDPDQYSIWHSGQPNNIMRYKNLRIDKLLEDGRIQSDKNERKKIYADFQKYLIDDAPATFLYFPYSFTISR